MSFSTQSVNTMSESDKIWIACALDCEGTIGFLANGKTNHLHPNIDFSSTDIDMVTHFKELVGINTIYCEKNGNRLSKTPVYRFKVIRIQMARDLLRQIIPYLISKKKKAICVLEFCEDRMSKYGKKYTNEEVAKYNTLVKQTRRRSNEQ